MSNNKSMLNLSEVRQKMTDKPEGQRIWNFFKGAWQLLSVDQITEIKAILTKDHIATMKMLDEAIKKQNAA